MKIEAGRYYRTRDGRKVGPMELAFPGGHYYIRREIGRWIFDGTAIATNMWENPQDLVSEWAASPVRERTTKEIVSGKYGHVTVQSLKGISDIQVGIGIVGTWASAVPMNSAELTAAIATLTTIRDALDEVA